MMYELCKMQIKNGGDKSYMMSCLGCFLMTKQITQEQYMELMGMLNPAPVVEPQPVAQPVEPQATTVVAQA